MYRAVSQQVMQIWGRAYPQALSEVLQLSAEIPSVPGLYMHNQQNTHSTGCAWVPVSCLTALSGDDTTLGSALSAEAPSLARNALPSAGILLASACCLSPPIEQSLMMPSVDVSQTTTARTNCCGRCTAHGVASQAADKVHKPHACRPISPDPKRAQAFL